MTPEQAPTLTLGIDIGGSKTHGIVLDTHSRIVAERVLPTAPGPDGVVATALAVTTACLAPAGMAAAHLSGVGVGIPGRVDHRTGVVHTAVNLGIERLPLADRLGAELGVGVRVDNDVKATALGAADLLGTPDADLTYLNFGTGVSAATLSCGVLVRGADNLAGEIGHLPIEPDAGRCACGQHGCVEVLAGGGQITARLAALTPPASLTDLPPAEAHRIARGIAGAVQLVVLAHGSSTVAIGGGVVRVAPALADLARELLAERAAHSTFLASLDLPSRVLVLPADRPLAAIGAALVGRTSSA